MRVDQGRVKRITLTQDEVQAAVIEHLYTHSSLILQVADEISLDVRKDKDGLFEFELTCVFLGVN